MSRERRFCPSCGEPVAPSDGSGTRRDRALCDACYFDRYDLVDAPDRVELLVCDGCGAVRLEGEGWTDPDGRDYTAVAVDAVAESLGVHADAADVSWVVDPEQVDETTIRMYCEFTGTVRGRHLEETAVVPVKLGGGTCSRCGRIAGDDYAAVVQVRARGRAPDDDETERARELAAAVVEEKAETGNREAFVTETEHRPEGLDVKLSTTGLGAQVADRVVGEFGGSVSESETLVTEDEEGDGVYRVTYAVRLPPFRPGDVVDPEDGDGPVLVRSVRGNLKGVRLATGDPYEAPGAAGDAPDARRLGSRADAVETTVVAVEDRNAVQVLDPETYEARTVARPDYMDPDAETVPALRSEAGLHVLPETADG
jgi:nonsense-mediated mRNA decay protein 3